MPQMWPAMLAGSPPGSTLSLVIFKVGGFCFLFQTSFDFDETQWASSLDMVTPFGVELLTSEVGRKMGLKVCIAPLCA